LVVIDPAIAVPTCLDMSSLAGKVFVVTGGASGIGRSTVDLLHQRGAIVCVADFDLKGIEREREARKAAAAAADPQPPVVEYDHVDVSKRDQVDNWIEAVLDRHGRLDGAANVAGGNGRWEGLKPVADLLDEDWDRVIAVNLTGTMYCLRAQLRVIQSPGSIVNVSSIHGIAGKSQQQGLSEWQC
jgi:NAD(P)-dependent dehydrogenase (short-subunit alcohol dehydrogenase family)